MTVKVSSDMKLISFLHHHTVKEGDLMECELNAPEAVPIGVRRILSDSFAGIVCSAYMNPLHCPEKKIPNNNNNKKLKSHRLISECTYQCFLKKNKKSNLKNEMIILFVKVIVVSY